MEDNVVDILFFFDQFEQIVKLERVTRRSIEGSRSKYLCLTTQVTVLEGDSF